MYPNIFYVIINNYIFFLQLYVLLLVFGLLFVVFFLELFLNFCNNFFLRFIWLSIFLILNFVLNLFFLFLILRYIVIPPLLYFLPSTRLPFLFPINPPSDSLIQFFKPLPSLHFATTGATNMFKL